MNTSFDVASYLGIDPVIIALIFIWSLVWMAIAMWKAAKKNHIAWYVIFLLVHTLGILEILYIFVFSKMSGKKQEPAVVKKKRR